MKTINEFIQEAFITKQNIGNVRNTEGTRPTPPKIDYERNITIDNLHVLTKFLKTNDLMPKAKLKDKFISGGTWITMIKAISDWDDGYVLAYEWADSFNPYTEEIFIFKNDGVAPGLAFNKALKQKDVMSELDQIIDVFGKSDEWVDGNDR